MLLPAQRRWLVDPFFLAIWYHIRQNRPDQRALTGSEGSRSEREEREWVRRKTREGNLWSDLNSGTDSIGPREALFLSFSRVRLFLLSPKDESSLRLDGRITVDSDRRRGTQSGLSMKGEREDMGPFPISTHSIYDFESLHVRNSLGN